MLLVPLSLVGCLAAAGGQRQNCVHAGLKLSIGALSGRPWKGGRGELFGAKIQSGRGRFVVVVMGGGGDHPKQQRQRRQFCE